MGVRTDGAPLHALIGRLYEATLDDELWRAFLIEFAELAPPGGAGDGSPHLPRAARRPLRTGRRRSPPRSLALHFAGAISLRERFALLRAERDVARAALESLSVALLLLDERGRVLAASPAAERIASARDGIRLEGTGLSLDDRRADSELRRSVREAARVPRDESVRGAGAMVVARPSGRRPYELLVTPLPREGLMAAASQRVAVAVFLSEPGLPYLASEEPLRELYGLTPAEARLAVRLSRGESLEEASHALGIAIGTARNEVKQLFQKTRTHRQAELVHLLATGIARLGRVSSSLSLSLSLFSFSL